MRAPRGPDRHPYYSDVSRVSKALLHAACIFNAPLIWNLWGETSTPKVNVCMWTRCVCCVFKASLFSETLGRKKPREMTYRPINSVRDSFPTALFKTEYNQCLLIWEMKNVSFIVLTFTSLIMSNFVYLFVCFFFLSVNSVLCIFWLDYLPFCYASIRISSFCSREIT